MAGPNVDLRPSLTVGGRVNEALDKTVQTLLVEETVDGLYRCEIVLRNFDLESREYLYFDRKILDFGKEIKVKLGRGSEAGTVFTGRIIGLEASFPGNQPPQFTVLAEDRLQDLRMTRRTRTFDQSTDAAAFQAIAGKHGLSASIDAAGPQHKVIVQLNQSDLAFIRERAQAIDAEVWVDDRTLHVQSRGSRNAGDLTLTYGQELWEFSVLADLAAQRTAVTVTGWDIATKQLITVEAADAAIRAELSGDKGGGALLRQALGERKEQLSHTVPFSDAEARALAEATYRRAARRFLTGRGLAEGDTALRAGCHVTLKNLGPLFNGTYYVSEVLHRFDRVNGYRTQFQVQRPGIGG